MWTSALSKSMISPSQMPISHENWIKLLSGSGASSSYFFRSDSVNTNDRSRSPFSRGISCGPQEPRTAVFQINVTLLHPRISRLGLVFSLRNIADCKEVQSVQNFGEIQDHEGLRKRVYIGRVACRLGVNSCQTLAAAKLKASS